MRQFDCPQCGAPVVFKSSTAEAAVCSFCQSVVVRRDVNVELIGSMAQLPPDMSPLQIGTSGSVGDQSFTLLGRVRVAWEDGSWNEWFVEFGDQTRGWVGEAQGFLMILRQTALRTPGLPGPDSIKANQNLDINEAKFSVTDAKWVTCLGGEGELPDPVVSGSKWKSIDLESRGQVATLEASDQGWRFFLGKAVHFAEVQWQNLRQIPGWNGVPLVTERGKTSGFSCPSCGGVMNLRAAGLSMSAVCTHCGSLVDTSHPELTLVTKAAARRTVKPKLELGLRGKLDGAEWEVIGFMVRRDSGASWVEYLLFNPFLGFRWLTEFNGHWTLVDRLLNPPGYAPGGKPYLQGVSYREYANENCNVTYVEGEFYWQARAGEQARVTDYIAPPLILSRESYPGLNEVTWSHGRYAEVKELREGFNLPTLHNPLPGTIGIVQPNPYQQKWTTLKPLIFWAAIALLAVQIFSGRSCSRKNEYLGNFTFERPATGATALSGGLALPNMAANQASPTGLPPTTPAPILSPPFEVSRQGGVDITTQAAVNNSWLGLDFELIDQKTGARYPAQSTVEYYHGVDSDGSWKEGSQSNVATIPGVPPGTYVLAIDGDADTQTNRMDYTVNVASGRRYFSNFVLGLFVLLIYPVLTFLNKHNFEAKRFQ